MIVTRKTDLRTSMLLAVVNTVTMPFCKGEIYFMILFVIAFIWLCIQKRVLTGIKFLIAYIVLWGLSMVTMGVYGLQTIWIVTNIGRHILIPISYIVGVSEAPTGTLLTIFARLHLPKSFGISTVVFFRFLPTLSHELSLIRASLKFRGIGTGFFNTLFHLPTNYEKIMVPLLMRTTRIAEELSAAAMVRGVQMDNRMESFDEVSFNMRDVILSIVFGLFVLFICLCSQLGLFEVTI